MVVLEEIAAERAKQIAHGYDAAHDDRHVDKELGTAAMCLVEAAMYWTDLRVRSDRCPMTWPFETASWKVLTRRQQLIRASAFLVAEIERMDRDEAAERENSGK